MATVSNKRAQTGSTGVPPAPEGPRPSHEEPAAAEVMQEAAVIYPDTFPTPPTAEEIAAEAYAIYVARGAEHGRHDEDWLEAERRLRERHADAVAARDRRP